MANGSHPGIRRGGRQKGTPNKSTTERLQQEAAARALKVAAIKSGLDLPECDATDAEQLATLLGSDTSPDAVRQALIDAEDGTTTLDDAFKAKLGVRVDNAHDLLRYVYRDPRRPMAQRLDAAKAAIRYETPALSSTTLQTEASPASLIRASDGRVPLHQTIQQLLSHDGSTTTQVVTSNAPAFTSRSPSNNKSTPDADFAALLARTGARLPDGDA